MNIGQLFTRHARYRPDHLAFVFEDKRLTYVELNRQINKLANALIGLGIKKGDKVATILPNALELYESYWAIAKAGGAYVPLSTLMRGKALLSLLTDSDTVAIITNREFIPVIESIKPELKKISSKRIIITDGEVSGYTSYHKLKEKGSEAEPQGISIGDDDVINIMYTSGTTGLPKGIVHTHYVRAMYGMGFASSFRINRDSITLHAGSIVFNGSFVDMMPTIYVGATYILQSVFDAVKFIDTIQREKVTHIMLVPAQIIALLNTPNFSAKTMQSVEMILSLGAPLHREHKDRLSKVLPGRFYELYGLTEGFVTVLDRDDFKLKPDSVGIPTSFYDMKIVDEKGQELPAGKVGEIAGYGPILMKEYYKRPDLTAQAVRDGWLYSGDIGYMDEDGYLYLVDRKKDMMISGGISVYPRDIEDVIVQHPDVCEVAVFGIPDEKWGEVPLAAVILNKKDSIRAEDLKKWINDNVGAKFQRVANVVLMDDFPRSVAGKTLKREMRDAYWKGKQKI